MCELWWRFFKYGVSLDFTYVISVAFYMWNSYVGDSDGSGICASSGGVSLSVCCQSRIHILYVCYQRSISLVELISWRF